MGRSYGTEKPNQIDTISLKEGTCYFTVIQALELTGARTLDLQKKLNSYLSYILDGQFAEEYPDRVLMPTVVRIVLQHEATGIASQFLSSASKVFDEAGIGFEYGVFDDA
ncbi:MAG: DUF6572 domain-containing protein [Pseudomonadota bacterium]